MKNSFTVEIKNEEENLVLRKEKLENMIEEKKHPLVKRENFRKSSESKKMKKIFLLNMN